jgi:bacteriocin-like protein
MKDKLTSPVSESLKNTEEVPVELFELSEEDLQQIVGGLSLWDAFTGTVKDKAKAVKNTVVDIVTQGTPPTGKTAQDLLDPLPIGVLRRFRPNWFW